MSKIRRKDGRKEGGNKGRKGKEEWGRMEGMKEVRKGGRKK